MRLQNRTLSCTRRGRELQKWETCDCPPVAPNRYPVARDSDVEYNQLTSDIERLEKRVSELIKERDQHRARLIEAQEAGEKYRVRAQSLEKTLKEIADMMIKDTNQTEECINKLMGGVKIV